MYLFLCLSQPCCFGQKNEACRKSAVFGFQKFCQLRLSCMVLSCAPLNDLFWAVWLSAPIDFPLPDETTDKIAVHGCCVQDCEWEQHGSPSHIPLLAWMVQQHCIYLTNPGARTIELIRAPLLPYLSKWR